MSENKSIVKSIRFNSGDLKRIEDATTKKIRIEGRNCSFSQFVIDAVLKEVENLEKVEVEKMSNLTLIVNYRKDITSFEKTIKTRLKELCPQAIVDVGGDLVTVKLTTDKNREAIANQIEEELKKITKN